MDSQDPGHGYFTDLLNQDHVLDSTFIWQNETSPRTNDDSPPFPHNKEIITKKPARGVNFTPEEDKLLLSAWLNCSIDVVQGTYQKHLQLWGKFFEYFQQYKETTNERTIKSLTHRWSVIEKATNKFCGKLAQVVELNQSGMTEQDKFAKAKVMYQSLEKCSFQFEHCYHMLKNQPKWIGHTTKEDPKRRKMVSPSPSPSLISTTTQCSTTTEDNVFENDVIELDRPIGRKAEKGK
ncbi:glutathione S-transferase T3-like [Heracleum sosnowskyi]|uniref:Glutathione S-transferase T3-like n=1 Tax=Heracleum sosnowskyi TaxID=360622 RepID=A0AAD8HYC2_9APIA|nr:glutathione S-transferase T3-like [Heracleum sosnowskyi]